MQYCKFLEHYREYTKGNETPESIHLWCGLIGIAGAAERRFWIHQGFFNLILNLYVMFLAPAGVCAKSTAMKLTSDMLREVGAKVFEGSITKRKIVADMMENQQAFDTPGGKKFLHTSITFTADEFNELISSGGGEIIKFLTTIFSKENKYIDRTATQGCFELIRPFLNLVGNVVPQWFSQNLANDMSATGLMARFIIVSENNKRGLEPKPIVTKAQLEHRAKALEIMYWIFNEFGEIRLSPDGDQYYDLWYRAQTVDRSDDDRLIDYMERKNKVHVLKVAALMALGDCRKIIEVIDLKRAIHIIEIEERKLRKVYANIGTNKYSMYIIRILNILDSFGGKFPMRKLAQMLFSNLTNEEIVNIVKQLEMMGKARHDIINGVAYLVRVEGE